MLALNIFVLVLVLAAFYFLKKGSARKAFLEKPKSTGEETMESVADLDDSTLSAKEKNTAQRFKEIVQSAMADPDLIQQPDSDYSIAIKEISHEVFTYGMMRLNDPYLAGEYSRNNQYVAVNKQKFIDDAERKIKGGFFAADDTNYEKYILGWILRIRDNTRVIDGGY